MAAERGLGLHIDSCGTHGYHIGEPPDSRTISTAKARGIDLSYLRARKFTPADFEDFDLLLAMDSGHLELMRRICPPEYTSKVALFLGDEDVPDPYYGGQSDFDHVYDLCFHGCQAMLDKIA